MTHGLTSSAQTAKGRSSQRIISNTENSKKGSCLCHQDIFTHTASNACAWYTSSLGTKQSGGLLGAMRNSAATVLFTYGPLVLRILSLLTQVQVTKSPKTMRFKFAIQRSRGTADSRLLMRNYKVDQKTRTLVGLLKALQRRTKARIKVEEVVEGTIMMRLKEWKMDDAEVDEWEKVLLSDSDIDL